jgi:hypothetical protein
MSATITERVAAGAAFLDERSCEAVAGVLLARGIKEFCGAPAAGRFSRACVHEHVRTGWLCQRHADDAASAFCRQCFELPAGSHWCPVAIAPVRAES